mmetsp:Transcript_11997/g.25806  ORF Transcript_11997/g.25806 Transcript_11997/m.25806 type:complete len:322 (-) Transcript_11997:221-1186(-)
MDLRRSFSMDRFSKCCSISCCWMERSVWSFSALASAWILEERRRWNSFCMAAIRWRSSSADSEEERLFPMEKVGIVSLLLLLLLEDGDGPNLFSNVTSGFSSGRFPLSVALDTRTHTSLTMEGTSTKSFRSVSLPLPPNASPTSSTLLFPFLPLQPSLRHPLLPQSLLLSKFPSLVNLDICMMFDTRSSNRMAQLFTILNRPFLSRLRSLCDSDSDSPMMPWSGLLSSWETTAMNWFFFSSTSRMRVTSVRSDPMPTMPMKLPEASWRDVAVIRRVASLDDDDDDGDDPRALSRVAPFPSPSSSPSSPSPFCLDIILMKSQ